MNINSGTAGITLTAVAGTAPVVARSATATDDDLRLLPFTGGAARFAGILTSADLTADRTYTFPNTTGTLALTANDLSVFAATTSLQLLTLLSDETGTGLAVFGTAPTLASTLTIGTAGGTTGAINLRGTTSGTLTLTTAAAAGTWTLTLPTTAGTASQVLQTDGAGVTSWATAGGGGSTFLVFGTQSNQTSGISSNTTTYFHSWKSSSSTTEDNALLLVPKGGTVKNLYVLVTANTLNGNFVVTLRKNGVDTALATTLASGATTGNDTVNTFTVVAGDRISARGVTTAASSGSATNVNIVMEMAF